MNTSSIFDAEWDCYDYDENLNYVQLNIYRLFGEKEEMDFRKVGPIHGIEEWKFEGKIEYTLAERIRNGDLIWRGMLEEIGIPTTKDRGNTSFQVRRTLDQ